VTLSIEQQTIPAQKRQKATLWPAKVQPVFRSRLVLSKMNFRHKTVIGLPFLAMPSRSFTGSVLLASKPHVSGSSSRNQAYWSRNAKPMDVPLGVGKSYYQCTAMPLGLFHRRFLTMWYLKGHYPGLDIGTTMALSSKLHPLHFAVPSLHNVTSLFVSSRHSVQVTVGLATSLPPETPLLRARRDRLSCRQAFSTATGMSFACIVAMEGTQNLVDYHLTGGVVAFSGPKVWVAAALSMCTGLLAPLPFNDF
jgi:hypothetical protein